MDAPIITATLQSGALGALSNVLGQIITSWQAQKPWALNWTDLINFALFSVLNCPPNYLWQSWLEASFPGYTERLTAREKEQLVDEAVSGQSTAITDDGRIDGDVKRRLPEKAMSEASASYGKTADKKLNVNNTLIKFALDQTIGAAVNTIIFIAGMGLLRYHSWDTILSDLREQFWPMIFAGQKFWPLISIVSFTLIPLERRTLFGAAVGVIWGIYLSLVSSGHGS